MTAADWFGDFKIEDAWTKGGDDWVADFADFANTGAGAARKSSSTTGTGGGADVASSGVAAGDDAADGGLESELLSRKHGEDFVHKRGLTLDITALLNVIQQAAETGSGAVQKMHTFLQYFILYTYGQRNIRKDAVDESKLTAEQREVYHRIRTELRDPARRMRILEFISKKEITRRLINYFVVHYSLVEREISYYLDRRTYPYRVIGEINKPDQPEVLKLIEGGANIVWINFHQEYKNSKNKNGRRNRHAPYRRSTSVQGADGVEYSLCELNFYLWLDDVGGFDLFYRFETDVRDRKAEYDKEKRLQESQNTMNAFGKKRKKKIVLRNTDGRNYKTHVVQVKTPAAFSILPTSCSLESFKQTLKRKHQQMQKDAAKNH